MCHLYRTCSPLGPRGVQVRLWPIPPTRVINSSRSFPPAGGCGPSGPKPHATKPASSRLPLALVTRPGTPTPPDVDSHPAPTPQVCVTLTHTTLHTAHCTFTFALLRCILHFNSNILFYIIFFIYKYIVSYILCASLMCSTFL